MSEPKEMLVSRRLHIGRLIGGLAMLGVLTGVLVPALGSSETTPVSSTKAKAELDKKNADVIAMAEEFGLIIGPVTEDIRKELNLRSAEGVAVFEVIGDSLAEVAGIKVGAVIAEINKKPVKNLEDFGKYLTEALDKGNFTVGTWEPTNPENQGIGQQMNFHFVPKRID